MRIEAVLNRDGGTFRTADMDAFQALADETFSAHGHQFRSHVVPGAQLCSTIDAVLADRPDALVAGGGDGTVSAAAARCWKSGVALGVVPAGTMNLFARSIGIPLDPEQALSALAGAQVRRVDIATANGVPFVHQFSAGFHARMINLRNSMEFGSRPGKVWASAKALLATVFDPPSFPVQFNIGDAEGTGRFSTVSISNNLFGEGHMPYADFPDEGQLGVYLHPEIGFLEGIVLVWKAVQGRYSEIPNLEIRVSDRAVLEFPWHKRRARAVIDGEVHPLDRRVELVCHRGELLVLAPQGSSPDQA